MAEAIHMPATKAWRIGRHTSSPASPDPADCDSLLGYSMAAEEASADTAGAAELEALAELD